MKLKLTNPKIVSALVFSSSEPSRFREPPLRKLQTAIEKGENFIQVSDSDINQILLEIGNKVRTEEKKEKDGYILGF